jgi:hypothetical protein
VKSIGSSGLWEIGTAWMKDGSRRTVLVAMASKRVELESGLRALFGHSCRDFVLLVANSEWCGRDLGPRMDAVGGDVYHLGGLAEIRESALVRSDMAERLFGDGPATTAQSVLPSRRAPCYLLRQGSGAWVFAVNGLDGTIADEKGLRYVEYLFKNPPSAPIHAIQLQADVCEVEPGKGGIVEIVDPDSGERITLSRTARIQERNLSIDNRESNRRIWKIRQSWQAIVDDEAVTELERVEAREQLASLDKLLSSWAMREKSNAAKTYDRIRQAITRLLAHLDAKTTKDGKNDPAYVALAEHIRVHLVETSRRYSGKRTSRTRAGTAQTFMYERPDGVIWAD